MKYEGTKIGITITTATNPFTRAEYLFKNWNTKADGTGTSYAEGAKATFTGNATLYAIWDKAYYQNTTSEKYYITLKDAVNGSATGTEIIAIDNATETVTATIPKVKTLTLNINGKTITFNGANNINNNGTLTITGGTIDGKNSTVNCIYNTGELTISGSTTNIYGRTNGTNRVINNQSTGKINMLEGKVIASESNDGALLNYGNFNMTGGELTTGGTSTGKTIWNEGTIEISGGKITASGSSEGVLINKGNFNMTGGTIDGRSAVGHCIVNNGELTISGSSTYIHGCGKYVSLQNKGSATINGGYIYGYEETCIWNYTDAKCNINGGTFESEEIRTVYNQGILNITAGYFKNSGTNVNNNSGVLSNATEGIAEITGGTFDAKDSKTSCMINEGKLTLGDNNEPVSTEVPELIGNKNGIHVESESEFNFYDGIIKGATAIYGTVTDTPTGYGVVTSTTDGIQAATLSNKYTLTVKHYLENADNTNYTEVPTAKTTKEVTYGDIITLANHETTITNGTYSYGSLTESTTRATSSKETTITEDTTIVLYYTRKTYTLTLNKDSNVDSVSGGGKHKVGARIQIQATMKSSTDSYTYSFTGWTGDDTSVVENTQENPTYVTMPSKDITLKVNGKQSTKIITY